jgi:hypothetical protein
MGHKAAVAEHSTAANAGAFARQINAASLVLTHFSGRITAGRVRVLRVRRTMLRFLRMNAGNHLCNFVPAMHDDVHVGVIRSFVFLTCCTLCWKAIIMYCRNQ